MRPSLKAKESPSETTTAIARLEAEIAYQRQRDLDEWFKQHQYDISCFTGSFSEFKL